MTLQKDNLSQLRPAPGTLTGFTPFVGISSVLSHPLHYKSFRTWQVSLSLFKAVLLFYFCWEFGEAYRKSSFQNMLKLLGTEKSRLHLKHHSET